MGKRLQSAEAEMAALEDLHDKLAQELLTSQETFQTDVWVKLCDHRVEEPTEGKMRLHAPAPKYIPSSSNFLPNTDALAEPGRTGAIKSGTTHTAVPCLAPYDGRTDWEAYHIEFVEMLVQVNG